MRHRLLLLALLPVLSVALAACGGSSPASTAPAASTSSTASTAVSSTTSSVATASAGTSTKSTAGNSSASSAAAGTTRPTGGASPSGGGSSNARVPATFSIRGGRLTPNSVSAPAFLAVEVSVHSRDSTSHEIVVSTPTPHTFTVAAGGHATLLIPGQRAGAYAVSVDGVPKGALIIGGEPGP